MHLDVKIADLARRQHSVLTRQQLIRVGASEEAIRHRLHRIHHGVYAVGHGVLGPKGRYLAAVLACGEDGVLSHGSAAALWGLRPVPSGAIDVTTPRRRGIRRPGIAVHATRSLEPEEVTACEGITCTTVARTLLDLAGVVTSRALDRAIEQSMILRLYDHRALEAVLDRAQGRRGTGTLRRKLASVAYQPHALRSELERRFLELVRRAELPAPMVNGRVSGYEVDFCWVGQRLIVETDGRRYHDTPHGFERDRQRDLDLTHAGWHVVRVSWRQLLGRPAHVSAMLRKRLVSN